MRLISQSGTKDVSYEKVLVDLIFGREDENQNIIEFKINAVTDVLTIPMAIYSSREKAEKVLEDMRGKYLDTFDKQSIFGIEDMWDYPKVFRFPQDSEVEL